MMKVENREDLAIRLTKSTRDQMVAYAAKDKVLAKYLDDPSLLANIMIEMLIECRKPVLKTLSVRYWVADDKLGHILKEVRIPDLGEGYSVMDCIKEYDLNLYAALEQEDIHSVEEVA